MVVSQKRRSDDSEITTPAIFVYIVLDVIDAGFAGLIVRWSILMTLKQGDYIPDATFVTMGENGPEAATAEEIFANRSVALFGLPGAYTPVCHKEHLPGIIALSATLVQNGIDTVACTSVNDVFVMQRWAEELGAHGDVLMLADGNADFAVKSGLAIDLRRYGLGIRSNRYAMLVADRRVAVVSVEETFIDHKVSSAASLYEHVDKTNRQTA